MSSLCMILCYYLVNDVPLYHIKRNYLRYLVYSNPYVLENQLVYLALMHNSGIEIDVNCALISW